MTSTSIAMAQMGDSYSLDISIVLGPLIIPYSSKLENLINNSNYIALNTLLNTCTEFTFYLYSSQLNNAI